MCIDWVLCKYNADKPGSHEMVRYVFGPTYCCVICVLVGPQRFFVCAVVRESES